MPLRDELQQMLRWELSSNASMQQAYDTGEYERLLTLPQVESMMLLIKLFAGLRECVFRLADEVDALKLDAGS